MKYTPNLVTHCLLDLDCERKEKHILCTKSLWEVQSRDFDSREKLKILDVQLMHLLGCQFISEKRLSSHVWTIFRVSPFITFSELQFCLIEY